ncbi:MAG: type II secretion system protein GspD [Gemmatimonadales bacterium]
MRRRLILLVALAFVVPAIAAHAQEPEPVRVTGEGVLVDFQDADLRVVITALAEAGGLNVVYGDLPARRVTLRMRQPVPKENLLALLRSLAQSNGLRVTEDDTFIRLELAGQVPAAAAKDTAAASEELRLYVHRLKHVRAARLASTLQTLFTGAARPGLRDVGSGTVPLSESLRQTQGGEYLRSDTGRAVTVDVAPAKPPSLPGQLHGDIQIVADETTNSLLVRAQPADWAVVQEAIAALDLRPLQVMIEVVIAEVRRTSETELSLSGTIADSKTDPAVRGTIAGNTSGNLVLEALRAGSLDVSLALSILSSRGDVRIISRPIILAQNNQEARILIGSERPFIQVSRSLPTDAAVRDQVIQYRDVGTKLTITPTINEDGYVNLQVLQEVSTATAETQFGAPVISTREAATHLFIKDGRTAVLGGLIDRQQERSKTGIPILMELPLVGGLFGTTRNVTSNSELFLFLTPRIVATDEDTERVSDALKQQAPLLQQALQGDTASSAPPESSPRNPLQP